MTFNRYLKAEQDINQGLIRRGLSEAREGKRPINPDKKMATMRAFLKKCGDPQKGIPAIHVAGTSGKGSVCAKIAGMLTEIGLKVGLHVSPYLQSATEKIWVADRFISSNDFADLVDWVMPLARPLVTPDTPASIHGMASVAIALEGFRREEVDVMVFEAGCGGRYDLSSFLDTTVGVITNIGLDHVISLGPGIEQIAWHKAGIARPDVPLVTGADGNALPIIAKEAAKVGAPLIEVPPKQNPREHNQRIAVEAATRTAHLLGKTLTNDDIQKGSQRVQLAGRFEKMPQTKPLVLMDGAHNPDKLACALGGVLQAPVSGKNICVFGAIGAKAGPALIAPLNQRFDTIITTEPPVYAKSPFPAEDMAKLFETMPCEIIAEADPQKAFDLALAKAGDTGRVVVTGSFYLVGALRNRWYPVKEVVMQRTSTPSQ